MYFGPDEGLNGYYELLKVQFLEQIENKSIVFEHDDNRISNIFNVLIYTYKKIIIFCL